MKLNIFYLILLLALFSCKKNESEKYMSLAYFHAIEVDSYFQIEIVQGNINAIKIEGDKKLINKLAITVKDSVLNLKNKSHGTWSNPKKHHIKLTIYLTKLQKLNLNETCQISSLGEISGTEIGFVFASKLNEANFNLNYDLVSYYNNHPCGGKLTLSGKSKGLVIWNYALMQVDAKELICENVNVENSSKGDCSVFATNGLKYALKGQGNIILYGNPPIVIEEERSSSGILIKK